MGIFGKLKGNSSIYNPPSSTGSPRLEACYQPGANLHSAPVTPLAQISLHALRITLLQNTQLDIIFYLIISYISFKSFKAPWIQWCRGSRGPWRSLFWAFLDPIILCDKIAAFSHPLVFWGHKWNKLEQEGVHIGRILCGRNSSEPIGGPIMCIYWLQRGAWCPDCLLNRWN